MAPPLSLLYFIHTIKTYKEMKKTTSFLLGALAATVTVGTAAILMVQHYRQKELEKLIAQRLTLQRQLIAQQQLLEEAMQSLETAKK